MGQKKEGGIFVYKIRWKGFTAKEECKIVPKREVSRDSLNSGRTVRFSSIQLNRSVQF